MNPVPIVTIAVRVLGLILILLYIGSLGRLVVALVAPLVYGGLFAPHQFLLDIGSSGRQTPEFLQLLLVTLGLYLFLSGRWVIARLTRGLAWHGGGTCPKCGYDITGIESSRCPECGTKLLPRSPP